MKKQLLSIFAALATVTAIAQPSPSWNIPQNPQFTTGVVPVAGTRFMDAVDANVVWLSGYDGNFAGANYAWYSRTINGGTSYNSGDIYSDTNTYKISNMEGIDANTAWVSAYMKSTGGEGAIHQTTNGGSTWQNMTAVGMFTNTTYSFANFVTFLTPQLGIVNGDPIGPNVNNLEFELWTTSNGGTSWTPVPGANIPNPLAGEYAIVNLYCKDGSTNVWFGTNRGRVYRTTDAGQTWFVSNVGPGAVTTNTVLDIAFAGPLNGICLMVGAGNVADLYNTVDGGVTWNLVNPSTPGVLPVNYGLNEMTGIPGSTYFASVDNGGNMISYSTDNGATWTDWGSVGLPYLTIDFVNPYTGWAGGFQGFPNGVPGVWKYGGVTFNSIFNLPINVCKPNATVTVTPVNNSSGQPPLTFSWSAQPAGAVFSSNTASVPVITFSANGTYTVTLNVLNGNSQLSTSQQIINVLSCGSPTASFNIPATVCNNSAFTLTNTSTGVPLPTYTITTSASTGVTVTPVANTNSVTIKFSTPGVYTITSMASSISGSSAATQTINVIDCSPVANFYFYIAGAPTVSVSTATGCVETPSTAAASATNLSTSSNGVNSYTWTVSPNTGVTVTGPSIVKNYIFSTAGFYTVTLKAANISGSSTISKVIEAVACVGGGIGLNENVLASNLNVYPNPAHDQLNIALPVGSDYKVKLINVIGGVVYEAKNQKDVVSINLVNKAKGIYFLTVESNSEKVVKKIVVE